MLITHSGAVETEDMPLVQETATLERDTEIVNGYIVDKKTGEIINEVGRKSPHIETGDDLDSAMRSYRRAEVNILGLQTAMETEVAAVIASHTPFINEQKRRLEWQSSRLMSYAASQLKDEHGKLRDPKNKSIKTPLGTLSFETRGTGSIKVIDNDKALDYVCTLPTSIRSGAIKHIPASFSILVTPLKGMESKLPTDAFTCTPPEEKFVFKTGVDSPKSKSTNAE